MISKKKRIEELERENRKLYNKNSELTSLISSLEQDIKELTDIKSSMPDRCVAGEYCKVCSFATTYETRGIYGFRTHYICGKGQSCPDFVQVKED